MIDDQLLSERDPSHFDPNFNNDSFSERVNTILNYQGKLIEQLIDDREQNSRQKLFELQEKHALLQNELIPKLLT